MVFFLFSSILTFDIEILYSKEMNLRQNKEFFKNQLPKYQEWLNATNIGEVLTVKEFETEKELYSLHLGFQKENVERAVAAWKKLKQKFESNHSLTLEQQLFYKMLHVMEVPSEHAKIFIFDTFEKTEIPCFDQHIYFDEGKVQYLEEPFCRSQVRKITIDEYKLKDSIKRIRISIENKTIAEKKTRDEIYTMIFEFAKQFYTAKNAKVTSLENQELLRFDVINLRKEVLNEETDDGLLASSLRKVGVDVNWVKREWLIFTIQLDSAKEGIHLECEIDGKFGSGFYQPRLGGYMDMEPDFELYLKRYTNIFLQKIKELLQKQ